MDAPDRGIDRSHGRNIGVRLRDTGRKAASGERFFERTEDRGDSRAADMHILNIREKIEPDSRNPRYLLTVRGMGYKFAEI